MSTIEKAGADYSELIAELERARKAWEAYYKTQNSVIEASRSVARGEQTATEAVEGMSASIRDLIATNEKLRAGLAKSMTSADELMRKQQFMVAKPADAMRFTSESLREQARNAQALVEEMTRAFDFKSISDATPAEIKGFNVAKKQLTDLLQTMQLTRTEVQQLFAEFRAGGDIGIGSEKAGATLEMQSAFQALITAGKGLGREQEKLLLQQEKSGVLLGQEYGFREKMRSALDAQIAKQQFANDLEAMRVEELKQYIVLQHNAKASTLTSDQNREYVAQMTKILDMSIKAGIYASDLSRTWDQASQGGIVTVDSKLRGIYDTLGKVVGLERDWAAARATNAAEDKRSQSLERYFGLQQAFAPKMDDANTAAYAVKLNQALAVAQSMGLTTAQVEDQWKAVVANGLVPAVGEMSKIQTAIANVVKISSGYQALQDAIAQKDQERVRVLREQMAATKAVATWLSPLSAYDGTEVYGKVAVSYREIEAEAIKVNASTQTLNDLWNKVVNKQAVVEQRYGKLYDAMRRLHSITASYSGAVNNAGVFSQGVADNTNKAVSAHVDMNKELVKAITSWKSIFAITGSHMMYRGVSLMVTGIQQGAKDIIDIQRKIAEIQTVDPANMPFEYWIKSLRELSNLYGLDVKDQIEGAYETLSNQVATGAEATEFLSAANRLAVTSVSSVTDAVNLLSSALNAYNLNVADSERMSAEFFKTIEVGRVRASEMANVWGRVGVTASELGIATTELNAMIASLTIKGVKNSEALTQIRNIMSKLLSPTREMREFLYSLGVTTGEAAIAAYGFVGVLQEMQKYTEGSTSKLSEMFTNVRGLAGILGLQGRNLIAYNRALKAISESQADYSERTALVMANTGKQMEQQIQILRNYFTIDLGTRALKTVVQFTDAIGGVQQHLDTLTFMLKNTFIAVTTTSFLTATVKLQNYIDTLRMANYAMRGLDEAQAKAAQSAALLRLQYAAMIVALTLVTGEVWKAFKAWRTGNADVVSAMRDNWRKYYADMAAMNKTNLSAIEGNTRDAINELYRMWNAAAARNSGIDFDLIRDNLKEFKSGLSGVSDAMDNTMDKIAASIKKTADELKKLTASTEAFEERLRSNAVEKDETIFAYMLEGADTTAEKVKLLTDKIKELDAASKELAERGLIEESERSAFDELRDRMREYYAERRSLIDDAVKRNKDAQEEMRKLDKDRAKEERNYELARREAELDLQKAMSKGKKGSVVDPEKVADAQRKLNDLTIKHREKLSEIAEKQKELKLERVAQIDHQKTVLDMLKTEREIQEQIVKTLKEKRTALLEAEGNPEDRTKTETQLKAALEGLKTSYKETFEDMTKETEVLEFLDKVTSEYAAVQRMMEQMTGQEDSSLAQTQRLYRTIAEQRIQLIKNEQAQLERKNAQESQLQQLADMKAELEQMQGFANSLASNLGMAAGYFKSLEEGALGANQAGILAFTVGNESIARRVSELQQLVAEANQVAATIRALEAEGMKPSKREPMILRGDGEDTSNYNELTKAQIRLNSLIERQAELRKQITRSQEGKAGAYTIDELRAIGLEMDRVSKLIERSPTSGEAIAGVMKLKGIVAELSASLTNLSSKDVSETAKENARQLQLIIVGLNEVINKSQETVPERMATLATTIATYTDLQNRLTSWITEMRDKYGSLTSSVNDTGIAMDTLGSQIDKAAADAREAVRAYNDLTQAINDAKSAAASGMPTNTPTPANRVPGYATGGSVHGVDTIPALLRSGEFVLNRRATQVMYSQLLGTNSGLRGMAGGGSVTLNGGINVNLSSSGAAQLDARQVAQAIKRELKRGMVSRW